MCRAVIEGHTSHVTRHTSHVTRHKSRVTRHTSHVKRLALHHLGNNPVERIIMRRRLRRARVVVNEERKDLGVVLTLRFA